MNLVFVMVLWFIWWKGICGIVCQKQAQAFMAWISNCIPQYSMICNYLSMFTSFLILAHRSSCIYSGASYVIGFNKIATKNVQTHFLHAFPYRYDCNVFVSVPFSLSHDHDHHYSLQESVSWTIFPSLLTLYMLNFQQKHRHVFAISSIPSHWLDTGSWNFSRCKTRIYLVYM